MGDQQKRGGDRRKPSSGGRSQSGSQGRGSGASRGSGQGRRRGSDARRDGKGRDSGRQHRDRDDSRDPRGQQRRGAINVEGGPDNLPKWLREEIIRTTKKDLRDAVLGLLSGAATDFEAARYPAARKKLLEAKGLSSRAGAIRELLGLAAYRMSEWEEALRELRAFRRIAGDTTHMAIEMDSLRALGRTADVHKTWQTFLELGGRPAADAEARVVYGAFLLDEGDPKRAWETVRPKKLQEDAAEWDLRRWYVAARAAAQLGDQKTATQLARAIEKQDAGFPGMEELHRQITG